MKGFIGRLIFENTANFFIGVAGTVICTMFLGRSKIEPSGGGGLSSAQSFTDSSLVGFMVWGMLAISLTLLALAVSRSRSTEKP